MPFLRRKKKQKKFRMKSSQKWCLLNWSGKPCSGILKKFQMKCYYKKKLLFRLNKKFRQQKLSQQSFFPSGNKDLNKALMKKACLKGLSQKVMKLRPHLQMPPLNRSCLSFLKGMMFPLRKALMTLSLHGQKKPWLKMHFPLYRHGFHFPLQDGQ